MAPETSSAPDALFRAPRRPCALLVAIALFAPARCAIDDHHRDPAEELCR